MTNPRTADRMTEVLMGPDGALHHLSRRDADIANALSQYGQGIRAGDIVLSGSFIRPIECPSGSQIHADFGGFGSVHIAFD